MADKISGKIKYVLLAVLVLLMTGCGRNDDTHVTLYYLDRTEPMIVTKDYILEKTDRVDSIYEILEQLGKNQDEQNIEPPLANGFSIISAIVEDKVAVIDVDEGYSELQADKELLIRTALVRSVIQVEGVDSVKLTVSGKKFKDKKGRAVGEMTADTFVIGDDIVSEKASEINVKLYFADSYGNGLKAASRKVSYNGSDSLAQLVLEQLISGPLEGEGGAVINPKTRIKSVVVSGGICHIDLSREFEEQSNNISTDVAIYSIVNTLTELSDVSHVRFSVEGNDEILYQGKYSFTQNFDANEELIVSE